MAGLSDVLGGVYNNGDPTPDRHDAATLDEGTIAEETEAAAAWDRDEDDDEPTDDHDVRAYARGDDDGADDVEPEALGDADDTEVAEPDEDDDAATPVWNLGSSVDDQDIDWTPDAPVPWDQVADEPDGDEPEAASYDPYAPTTGDDDSSDAEHYDGVLGTFGRAGDDASDGPGPWLRADDDILPSKKRRGIAFWRR